MYKSILEFILLLIIEYYTFIINEVEDRDTPDGATEELDHELVHPFLYRIIIITSSYYFYGCYDFFFFFYGYYFLPNSHYNILVWYK